MRERNYVLLAVNGQGAILAVKILGPTYAAFVNESKAEMLAKIKQKFPDDAKKPVQFTVVDFNNPLKNGDPFPIEHKV